MRELLYRTAGREDIPGMAQVRAGDWETEEFWNIRILHYLACLSHPRESLPARAAFVCIDGETVAGLVAGHLTRRFGCDGELQWISVRPHYRGSGVASELLRRMAEWFVEQGAVRVCVDVEPANEIARRFYRRHGADDLQPSWMVWEDIRRVTSHSFEDRE